MEYRIDPELIFELHRPLLKQLEPPTPPPLPDAAGAAGQQGPEEGELPEPDKGAGEEGEAGAWVAGRLRGLAGVVHGLSWCVCGA